VDYCKNVDPKYNFLSLRYSYQFNDELVNFTSQMGMCLVSAQVCEPLLGENNKNELINLGVASSSIHIQLDSYNLSTDVWNNTSQGKAYKWQSGFPDTSKGKCIAAKSSLLLNANCEDPMQFFCEK
jgi:hypothetical protein